MNEPMYESPVAFAKRTGLGYTEVVGLAKSGRIPFIKTGKRNIKIDIEGAKKALSSISKANADAAKERVYTMQTVRKTNEKGVIKKRMSPETRAILAASS